MKTIHFYISNSNHHWQMMKPVMEQLSKRNVKVVLVSLCEFRRMQTPEDELKKSGIAYIKLASLKFKGTSTSTGKKHIGGNKAFIRNVLRGLVWHFKVRAALSKANIERPNLVVVPNDIAYPFDRICKWFTRNGIPFILQQEGIRFPLPNEEGGIKYGTNGATEILAWGQESVNYFTTIAQNTHVIAAGNPRFDNLKRIENSRTKDKSGKYNILYVSNPVDDQGFCTHMEKIELFHGFLKGIENLLREHDMKVFVRLHPREDIISFKNTLNDFFMSRVIWAQEQTLFEYLNQVDLTVILASTVGLESMMMGTPVAVIKLPRHGYVFNYVSSGSAIGIDVNTSFSDKLWKGLTVDNASLKEKCVTYTNNQLANWGSSVQFIANHLVEVVNANE